MKTSLKKNKKVASMLYSVAVLGTLLSPSVLNSASVVLAESIEEVGEVTTTIPEVVTEDKVDNNIVKDLVEDTKQPTPESVKGTETSTETGTVWYKEPSNIGIMLMILMFVVSIALGLYLIF